MFKTHWPLFFFVPLLLLIVITNANWHVSIIGWDNLLTQLNPWLNLQRSIFSTWQEYQGLGLLPGNSPAADIPRQLLLLPIELVFPHQLVRQIQIFSLYILGGMSMYIFLQMLFAKYPHSFPKGMSILFGSVLYVCNLATIQTFFVPFEPFLFQFAFLPILFALLTAYLLKPAARTLFWFAVSCFFAASQAQVPTIFLVTLLAITLILVICTVFTHEKQCLINSAKLLGVLLAINMFWLLPFFIFVSSKTTVVTQAKINQMATQIVILQNKEFGTLHNTALLQGFWFNNVDPTPQGTRVYMFEPWRTYIGNPFIQVLGFIFFAVILVGLMYLVWTRKPLFVSFAFLFLCSFACIATSSVPFASLTRFLQQHIPLWEEAFRFPFTKFSLLAGFTFSLLFAFGNYFLLSLYQEEKHKLYHSLFIFFGMIIFIFPLFLGNLLYSRAKQMLPTDYQQLFTFFKTQDPNTRIADFPQFTFWGWDFTTWQYSGSGFLWYDIQQPILDRAFDVWSSQSENYYWEIHRAIQTQNPALFQAICNKYDISWLVLDTSDVNVENNQFSAKDFQKFFDTFSFATKEKTFGHIIVYHVTLSHPPTAFVSFAHNLPGINTYTWTDNDVAYQKYGDYVANNNGNIYYPFRSLFTNQTNPLAVTKSFGNTLLTTTLPPAPQERTLTIPKPRNITTLTPFSLTLSVQNQTVFSKHVSAKDFTKEIAIPIPPTTTPLTLTISLPQQNLFQTFADIFSPTRVISCNPLRTGSITASLSEQLLHLQTTDATACFTIPIPTTSSAEGYILTFAAQNDAGRPLHMWIAGDKMKEAILDTFVPQTTQLTQNVYVFPHDNTKRITIHVENISIGNTTTANNIEHVDLLPLPYDVLTTMYLTDGKNIHADVSTPIAVDHPNPTVYAFSGTMESNQTIFLHQAYDTNWHLFAVNGAIPTPLAELLPFFVGKEIGHHVTIDNWANGWIIQNDKGLRINDKLILVFLPQYLEYVGFVIGGVLIIALLFYCFIVLLLIRRPNEND